MIHIDGAWGGVTPHGAIQMTIYSDLSDIPTSVTYSIDEEKKRLTEKSRQGSRGAVIVREIEAELIFTVPVAEAIVVWLNDKITQAKAVAEQGSSGTFITDFGANV